MSTMPLLCGRRVSVCDNTGLNLQSMEQVIDHIAEHPTESDIVLTSESYGVMLGLNCVLTGNPTYTPPRQIERTPGSSSSFAFGSGLMSGLLMGDM